jgi:hypothetical protein
MFSKKMYENSSWTAPDVPGVVQGQSVGGD